jgi:hypothetical protein
MNRCIKIGLVIILLSKLITVRCQEINVPENLPPKVKRTSLSFIPVISYNRSYGVSGGLLMNAFTNFKTGDTLTPPSMTAIGVGYTQNKSWGAVGFQRLFLNRDKLRIFWALGLGKSNFQFFQELDETGNGLFINYETHVQFFSTTVTWNVFNRVYTGIKYQYSKSVTEFDVQGQPDQIAKLSGFGIPVTFDSRNYVYNPSKGIFINFAYNNNAKWLGSDFAFSSLSLNANFYKIVNSKTVLAFRFFNYTGLGTVPFVGQKVVGGKDLRGYTNGEYRSNAVAAIQSEYRLNFYKKWGAVAFGGIANAFKSNGNPASGLLPAAGAGLRFAVIPARKINAGVDVAFGKNDWGIYFRIGEAF